MRSVQARRPSGTLVLAMLTATAVAALVWLSIPSTEAEADAESWKSSPDGPVGEADRALLIALRQHILFAVPTTQQAQQMAASPDVRAMSATFASDLEGLAGEVRTVAEALDVALPSQPAGQQRMWSTQISVRSGSDYDRALISRLRASCADTAALVRAARVDTRNEQIRRLADQVQPMVDQHLADLSRWP